jgi:toxin ParE1/3/4
MPEILITDIAKNDLLEAWLFIAKDNLNSADQVLDTINLEFDFLSLNPLTGRSRPELGKSIRSWPSKTAYIIFYQIENINVIILRVLHHARDIKNLNIKI